MVVLIKSVNLNLELVLTILSSLKECGTLSASLVNKSNEMQVFVPKKKYKTFVRICNNNKVSYNWQGYSGRSFHYFDADLSSSMVEYLKDKVDLLVYDPTLKTLS